MTTNKPRNTGAAAGKRETSDAREPKARPIKVRATISLPPSVLELAQELMAKQAFDTFSSYLAELVRRDKLAFEERSARLAQMAAANPDRSN